MSGPGPTGFRPEHVADMLKCKRRCAVNRLLRAIAEIQTMAAAGTLLSKSWAWIMDLRFVFIKKKAGKDPDQSGWAKSGGASFQSKSCTNAMRRFSG